MVFININSGGTPSRRRTGRRSKCRSWDRSRRCGTARTAPWPRRPTTSPANASWTSWPRAAGRDPLEFRLAHLENGAPARRARRGRQAVRLGRPRRRRSSPDVGVGLACGTEKGSYVAACVEVAVDRDGGESPCARVCQVFECGAILNPDNLLVAGPRAASSWGSARRCARRCGFTNGKILNAAFGRYLVPRFQRRAGAGHSPARPARPAVGRRGRDADHRHRPGHRQRRLPRRHRACGSARCRSGCPARTITLRRLPAADDGAPACAARSSQACRVRHAIPERSSNRGRLRAPSSASTLFRWPATASPVPRYRIRPKARPCSRPS